MAKKRKRRNIKKRGNTEKMKLSKILWAGIILVAVNSYSLTLGDIVNQVRSSLADVDVTTATQRWSDTELYRIINEGHRMVADTTWCITKSSQITLVVGTTMYALPDDCYVLDRVVYDSDTPLPETTIGTLDRDNKYWQQDSTGTPEKYYLSLDGDDIGLYYVPSASTTIDINYIAVAETMASTSTVPFNGIKKLYAYHYLLVYYTLWHCYTEDGQQNKANMMATMFIDGMKRMNQQIKVSPNFTPTFGVQ